MNETNTYLLQLKNWGEKVNQILDDAPLPKNEQMKAKEQLQQLREQIDSWIEKGNCRKEDIRELQNRGRKILQSFKQKDIIPYAEHKLPPLPYPYNALEPYISEEIMRLHHDIHHQSYVDGLNKAEKMLYKRKEDKEYLKHWLREQAFHGSGHYLHTIFWNNMTPDSSKTPVKDIKNQIELDFGSWENFKNFFSDTALSVEGVGWAVLFWHPSRNKLGIQSIEKHQLFQIAEMIPLLVLDMWEHAYYLQYKTNKEAYVKNFWNVVNWEDVNQRLLGAKQFSFR